MRHATDSDHVIAVTTIVSRQRNIASAALTGVFWGIGHSITLLVVGGAIILFGLVIPQRLGMGFEFCVALMLILLGWLNLRAFRRSVDYVISNEQYAHEHVHQHGDYIHRHSHRHDPDEHGHSEKDVPTACLDRQFGRSHFYRLLRPVIVGVVHGLAGSAAVALLVLPVIRDPTWSMGYREYEPIAERFKVPIVITGFEPIDILEGVLMTVRQLETGEHEVQNQYPRVVERDGNRVAQNLVNQVFEVCDRKWRGVGSIPKSGYKLRYEFREHDADRIFDTKEIDTKEPEICISGLVLKGVKKPHDCPAFGKQCTPEHPLGATMVSAEGACAAYYTYGRHLRQSQPAAAAS